jgi:hypothetical protein
MPAGNPSYLFTEPPVNLAKIGGGVGHGARQHSVDEFLVVEARDASPVSPRWRSSTRTSSSSSLAADQPMGSFMIVHDKY